jgi:hypothetical protein
MLTHWKPFVDLMNMRILLILTFAIISSATLAQKKEWEKPETGGELESVEVVIEKERQISLPNANRNFDKIPPRPSEPIKPPITYDFRSFSFQTPQINPQIKPLKLKQDNPSKIYNNYVTAGFGNYASPYLEGFVSSGKNRNKLTGAHAYLNSSGRGPVDGNNSASGSYGLSLYGQSISDLFSFSGNVGFDNRSTHFYGYKPGSDVDASDIKQSISIFKIGGSVANSKNSNFSYKLAGGFSYLSDKYSARETEVDFDLNSYYKINDDKRIRIQAGYYMISRKDEFVEAKPRNLFLVRPTYEFNPMEGLKLSAGATAAYENDSIDNKDFHIYPDFQATYALSPTVDAVGSLTGGVDKVTLQSLTNENLWLAPNVPIFHTNKLYDLQLGINAKLGNKVSASAGSSFAALKNWYFYRNDSSSTGDSTKFVVDYDKGATKRNNFFASLSYAQAEVLKLMLRADLYGYDTKNVAEAWHRPTYKVTANVSYNLYKKMLFKVDLITQGGMKALDPGTDKIVKIKGAFDLNARMEYLLSDSFSIYVQGNNITGNKYQVFLNYPVRGVQVMGGITWSF